MHSWTLACWCLGLLHGLRVRVCVCGVCVIAGVRRQLVFTCLGLLVYIVLADVIGYQCVNDEGERCPASGLVVMLLQYG